MAIRYPMIDLGDEHAVLDVADEVADPVDDLPYLTRRRGSDIMPTYATLAAAIADTANLVDGQLIMIQGGDNFTTGFPNADSGIWSVDSNDGAANTDYTKQLDISDKASEVSIGDSSAFFAGSTVEAALQEIGDKQIAYKRSDTSIYNITVGGESTTAFDAAITALILDNGSLTDSDGVGDTVTNGVLLFATRNHKLPIRDNDTGNSIDDGIGNEVYARLTNPAGVYIVEFYSDVSGTPTVHDIGLLAATGNIALSGLPNDADSVTIDDGVNPAVVFEYDSNASVVETAVLRQVVIGGSAAATITNLIAAIAGAPTLDVTASAGAGDSTDLINDTEGTVGNVALAETDTAAVSTLTGMAGGTNNVIDLSYVWVSMDFMKLPAMAGITEGEFFGDQAGIVGVIDDANVITNAPAFDGLLTGLGTQEAVNNKVDDLSSTANGEGASGIGVEDSAGNFTGTDVETVLAELYTLITDNDDQQHRFAISGAAAAAAATAAWEIGNVVIIEGTAPNEADRGIWEITANTGTDPGDTFPADYTKRLDISHTASEVLIADATSYFTGTEVEAALDELSNAIGGTASGVRDYSSNNIVADNDDIVVAIGKLDAAIGSAGFLKDCAFIADEAIPATTDGPRLVASTTTSRNVELANASTTGTNVDVVGFATGADYADAATINLGDCVVSDGVLAGFTGLTIGATYYADPAGEGDITTTAPTTVDQWVVPVGVAISATEMMVNISTSVQVVISKVVEVNIWFRSTGNGAGTGAGENGFTINPGDLWVDNDDTVTNPTKSGTDRYTVYVNRIQWVGAGAVMTTSDIKDNFTAVGKQN